MTEPNVVKKSKRGFASMSPEKQREIASKGGKAAHAQGVAHEFNAEEAKVAGKKGGTTVSSRPGYMAGLGSKGGLARKKKSQQPKTSEV